MHMMMSFIKYYKLGTKGAVFYCGNLTIGSAGLYVAFVCRNCIKNQEVFSSACF